MTEANCAPDVPFNEMDKANCKVLYWNEVASKARKAPINLAHMLDLTTSPSIVRATFPGMTPFRILSTPDVLRGFVRFSSLYKTAAVSVAFGVFLASVLSSCRSLCGHGSAVGAADFAVSRGVGAALLRPVRRLGQGVRLLVRFILLALVTYLYVSFLRTRLPRAMPISKSFNCSSSPNGPCFVVDNVLSVSNSHAGTHADMPYHFSRHLCPTPYDSAHYNGSCVVVDLSMAIRKAELVTQDRGITAAVMEEALQPLHQYLESHADFTVWRLFVVTRRLHYTPDDTWDSQYAYFYLETIEYLNRMFPHLMLLATDAASVDGEKAAPICDHCHGALLHHGIAILENVDGRPLYGLLEKETTAPVGVVVGSLLTVMSRTEIYPDSKGCSVLFFTEEEKAV